MYNGNNPIKSRVHAHYDDLSTLPEEIKAKMWLVHYQDSAMGISAVADGFKGFLQQGQIIEI